MAPHLGLGVVLGEVRGARGPAAVLPQSEIVRIEASQVRPSDGASAAERQNHHAVLLEITFPEKLLVGVNELSPRAYRGI